MMRASATTTPSLVALLIALAGTVGPSAQTATPAPTFTKDVAPIFYKNCVACHRPGEIAPMSLMTYAEARPWVRSIATQVSRGTMPPWHADPSIGTFANDRRLSDADKNTITKWASAGAPEGNPADLAAPPKFPTGWTIQPDAIFTMPQEFAVPASGEISYKTFEIPTTFTEDKWIQAFEIRPGAPSVVHHVIVSARPSRTATPAARQAPAFRPAAGMERPRTASTAAAAPAAAAREAARALPPGERPLPGAGVGNMLGVYVPGNSARTFDPGMAIRLPAGATIVLQMHYTATGTAMTDRTSVGFIFTKEQPASELVIAPLMNQNFVLKAGDANARVECEAEMLQDVVVRALLPHTHVRGKRWLLEAIYPDGRTETVLSVPSYDFNWQTDYVFKDPLKFPKGTRLHTTAWYDNSAANKWNPDPTKDVSWGDQTWEEMQFTFFSYTLAPAANASGH